MHHGTQAPTRKNKPRNAIKNQEKRNRVILQQKALSTLFFFLLPLYLTAEPRALDTQRKDSITALFKILSSILTLLQTLKSNVYNSTHHINDQQKRRYFYFSVRAEERRNRRKVSLTPNNTGLRGKNIPWGSLAISVIRLSLLNTDCIIYKNQFLGNFFWLLLSFVCLFVCF